MRSRFIPDRGLTRRMVTTMFVLGLLYVVFGAVLVALMRSAVLAVVIVAALLFAQYWFSDRIALRALGGRVVTPAEAPELHAVIDRLCALAGMPKPEVAVADLDVPNAFATGRSPDRAVVCATTGLLRRLDREELEGVLAHELSHVAHRDVAVMTIASFLGVLAGFITRFGMWSGMGRGRGRGSDNTALVVVTVVLVSVVVYALSFLLTRALSRYRELSADRAGALLTGHPSALAAALTKVTGEISRMPTKDLREAEAFNSFFFAPAISSGFSLTTLFATHPPLQRRLDQLGDIARQLGQEA